MKIYLNPAVICRIVYDKDVLTGFYLVLLRSCYNDTAKKKHLMLRSCKIKPFKRNCALFEIT